MLSVVSADFHSCCLVSSNLIILHCLMVIALGNYLWYFLKANAVSTYLQNGFALLWPQPWWWWFLGCLKLCIILATMSHEVLSVPTVLRDFSPNRPPLLFFPFLLLCSVPKSTFLALVSRGLVDPNNIACQSWKPANSS